MLGLSALFLARRSHRLKLHDLSPKGQVTMITGLKRALMRKEILDYLTTRLFEANAAALAGRWVHNELAMISVRAALYELRALEDDGDE